MIDIATAAGVAKGTLYNHFRTRDDVYRALAAAEAERLCAEFVSAATRDGPSAALAATARAIATHPALVRLRGSEPAPLAALLAADPEGASARAVRAGVTEVLGPAGGLALRWLASWVLAPQGDPGPQAAQLASLASHPSSAVGPLSGERGDVLPPEHAAP
jgi:AcrR family transcriptional regulator